MTTKTWIISVILIILAATGGAFFAYQKGKQRGASPTPMGEEKSFIAPLPVKSTRSVSQPTEVPTTPPVVRGSLPDFISSIRTYGGGGYDDMQIQTLKDAGYEYVQSLVILQWPLIEPRDDGWKWKAADAQMDALDRSGLKTIPHLMLSKNFPSVPWDKNIQRNSPIAKREYEEFAYEVVKRYKDRPSWSGLVAVWGGTADVWDKEVQATDPEIIVPLLNAVYDGIKRADQDTIVIGFNFATTVGSQEDWEEYHRRAFAVRPKFDWYGVQSHGLPPTVISTKNKYAGLQGLVNVRKFLDEHGYAGKPLWVNEGGYYFDETKPSIQAEQVVQTYIMGGALPVNLKGWVYFGYFDKASDGDTGVMALMTSLKEDNPPRPRLSWNAVKTLLKTVGFEEYKFDAKISGEANSAGPFVYRFYRKDNPSSKLWAVFLSRQYSFVKGESQRDTAPRDVTINIGANREAEVIEMLGEQNRVQSDSSGNIIIRAVSAPTYIKVDG